MRKKSTIGILGLGLFGTSVARTLAESDIDVIAMDRNMDHVEDIADDIGVAVQGDFTKIDQLTEAGIGECDEVVIAASEKLEDSILGILNLLSLEIEKITVKTKSRQYQEVLKKVGATRVILPEIEMGDQVGKMLANPTVHELMQLDSHYNIIEFPYREPWVGKDIIEIDYRNNYDTNVIAIKPADSENFTIEFGPKYVVQEDDIFIGVTTDEGMNQLLNS